MAIQIRRGSNAEWESNNSNIVVGEPAVATDSKRAFIGTASGAYMELANLEAIAPAYDPGNSYMIDDYVSYQGKLYVCTVPTSGAWDASAWQVTSLGQALAENAYSNYEIYTMSGDIVSFPNGAGGIPVKDLKADVEAVQDLHGYDHPWVGGAGKNLLDDTALKHGYYDTAGSFASNNAYISYEITSLPAGTYTFSTDLANAYIIRYLIDNVQHAIGQAKQSFSFTLTASANVKISIRNTSTSDISSVTPKSMVESGSSATTYEPYSNICPISGWDEVNVTRTGINVWDEQIEKGYISTSTGANSANTTGQQWRSINHIPVVPNIQLYCKIADGYTTSNSTITVYYYDQNKGFLSYASNKGNTVITIPNNCYYMRFAHYFATARQTTPIGVSINYPSTDHDHHAYNGQTYTIDLDGTRYGGTLDVTTGVLTLTYGRLNLGDISWQYISGDIFRGTNTSTIAPNMEIATDNEVPLNAICESYKVEKYNGSGAKLVGLKDVNQIRIQDPQYSHDATGASALHDKVNNTYLVYKFATPTTYQLTPTQVRTLLGENNIWADSGEVEVTYRISNVQ